MTIKQNMNTKDKLKRVFFNLLNIEVVGAMWTVYISLDSSVVVLPTSIPGVQG